MHLRRLLLVPCVALVACLIAGPVGATPSESTVTANDPAIDAEVGRFEHTLVTSQLDRWWEYAAVQEWNKAIGQNWLDAKAYLDAHTTHDAPPGHHASHAPSGGGTYSGNASGSVNGYPCGGDLPPCYVLKRESGGNPTAENPVSSASGLWQFIDGTWNGFGGYSHASDAPPEVQNEKARQTYAGGAGAGHWACC